MFDVSTDLGFPTHLDSPGEVEVLHFDHGAGASLDPAHAVTRALTELMQDHFLRLLDGPAAHTESDQLLSLLKRWPGLSACSRFDVGALLDRATTVPARELGARLTERETAPRTAFAAVMRRLVASGYRPGFIAVSPSRRT